MANNRVISLTAPPAPAAAPAPVVAASASPRGVVSLAGLRSTDPEPWNRPPPPAPDSAKANPSFKPRVPHPGGKMRSNKNEALLLFLKRKQHKGEKLTDEQVAALAAAAAEAAAAPASPAVDMLAKLEEKVKAGIESNPLLRQEKGRVAVVPAVVKQEKRLAAKQKQKQQKQQQQQQQKKMLARVGKQGGVQGAGRGAGRGRGGRGRGMGGRGDNITGRKRKAEGGFANKQQRQQPGSAKKQAQGSAALQLVARLNTGLGCGR